VSPTFSSWTGICTSLEISLHPAYTWCFKVTYAQSVGCLLHWSGTWLLSLAYDISSRVPAGSPRCGHRIVLPTILFCYLLVAIHSSSGLVRVSSDLCRLTPVSQVRATQVTLGAGLLRGYCEGSSTPMKSLTTIWMILLYGGDNSARQQQLKNYELVSTTFSSWTGICTSLGISHHPANTWYFQVTYAMSVGCPLHWSGTWLFNATFGTSSRMPTGWQRSGHRMVLPTIGFYMLLAIHSSRGWVSQQYF